MTREDDLKKDSGRLESAFFAGANPGLLDELRRSRVSRRADRRPMAGNPAVPGGAGPASPCFDAAAWGARVESLPTRLATLPTIDLVARVRSLHEILYPGS